MKFHAVQHDFQKLVRADAWYKTRCGAETLPNMNLIGQFL